MSLKKDKQKVLGEVFDEARVKSFLEIRETEGINRDYALLERAYRSMKAENFASFVGFFVEAGHDLNAKGPEGLSLLQIAQQHEQSKEYCAALSAAGAQA
ncbi:PA4642 family protein [Agaribacterium haliotis]|uniref:PA4642 family protein n=1 Tax=Agaribacterium haliotis TaxID=2013869 RepID=UPI000BB5775A|nr:PA4642 family protein [Agaribacterium haliotis]